MAVTQDNVDLTIHICLIAIKQNPKVKLLWIFSESSALLLNLATKFLLGITVSYNSPVTGNVWTIG